MNTCKFSCFGYVASNPDSHQGVMLRRRPPDPSIHLGRGRAKRAPVGAQVKMLSRLDEREREMFTCNLDQTLNFDQSVPSLAS